MTLAAVQARGPARVLIFVAIPHQEALFKLMVTAGFKIIIPEHGHSHDPNHMIFTGCRCVFPTRKLLMPGSVAVACCDRHAP